MENCLIQNYKDSIANPSLKFIDCVTIVKTSEDYGGGQTLGAKLSMARDGTNDVLLVIPADKSFTTKNQVELVAQDAAQKLFKITDNNYLVFDFPTGSDEYDIYIVGAKNLSHLTIDGGATQLHFSDVSDLKYNTILTNIGSDNAFAYDNIVGDLSDLANSVNLISVTLGNGKIGGRIETFAEKGWANGRRNGSLQIRHVRNVPTFNGVAPSKNTTYDMTFAQNSVVVSVSGVTVGTYDGTSWTYN